MKQRLKTAARWALYPLFYLTCLAVFGYVTFPWNRLKDRLLAEFDRAQAARSLGRTQRLEIDALDSYWLSGVEAKGVRVFFPPSIEDSLAAAGAARSTEDRPAPTETVLAIDSVHLRVRLLPLFIGRVRVDFSAEAFGGEISGTLPVGASNGPVEVQIGGVDLSTVEAIGKLVGIPVKGIASGSLVLSAEGGKFSKATGALTLRVKDASVGDGVTKIKGIALPEAKLGDIEIAAEATGGVLKISKMSAPGPDVELVGDGKVNVREPWNESNADLYVRFKFSDGYRAKNDLTKSLLGAPGSSAPPLFELADPKIKRAKRPDGFYGWRAHGPLRKLKLDPSATESWASKTPRTPRPPDRADPPKRPDPAAARDKEREEGEQERAKQREKEEEMEAAAAPRAPPRERPPEPPTRETREPPDHDPPEPDEQ